ncbi:unnamed protein product [Rangifer tarandus platyrhynchus]|uniref:Uncharacterized protein n=1 Tax=Rangifer tarandus platyrhynchus TaxID=3082113 RepID=A0ABN9A1V0_RANTA|nr:unnamed protein product [Rangifer tarandus platyrhynchus]
MPGAHQQLLVKLELVKLKRHRQPLTADLGGFPGDLAVKTLPGGPAVKTSLGGPVVKTLHFSAGMGLISGHELIAHILCGRNTKNMKQKQYCNKFSDLKKKKKRSTLKK